MSVLLIARRWSQFGLLLTVAAYGQISQGGVQGTGASPKFQVATVKPSGPDETRTMQIRGMRFATTGTTLVDLLKYAYGLQEAQIVGGPKWMGTEKFDMVGDPETETRPSSAEFKEMVQALLADRFHLTAHRETGELSVYEIVAAKGGARLTKSTRPPETFPAVGYSPGNLAAGNITITDLATYLQRFVSDRPVVDGTGISGKYDVTLRWTPDDAQPEASRQGEESSNTYPGFFKAIEEQLGLKLEEGKRPTPVLVVDKVEMPTEN